ncbi:carbohydrate esterase family 16 protein [Coniella lustricola]|uniref:Carbohydrate esterase family 16 protein n=1 Tax=Coniella lustricola TaxID=2025994 RepID=A0A2T3A3S3_9PEZI|nr:carbohydrate esterase family 16 protein [Coniella lustricola]
MHIAPLIPQLAAAAAAAAFVTGTQASHPSSHDDQPFTTLVTFGDSYTDDGRFSWYYDHDDQPPPAGVMPPQESVSASGGLAWGQYVQRDTGAVYYDYAVSGATCSNEIISRYLSSLGGPFPSVVDDEIPSFVADVRSNTLYANTTASNTVYALWIGTNDLGYGAFLTDSQAPGTNITTYIDCVWSVFDTIYSSGGRRFVLLNTAPLQHAPLYAAQSAGGAGDNQYWLNKTLYNQTEYQNKMLEYTQLVNRIFNYGAAYETVVEKRWPGVTFDVFDVNKLLSDMIRDPARYLDAPANVTGFYHHCDANNNSICTTAPEPLDTFLWYDELHPSNKTSSVIAKEFVSVAKGESAYGTRFAR